MLHTFIFLSSLIAYNLAANCCIDAVDEATCNDVATSTCLWIADDEAAMAKSQNIPCVSEPWYECEVNRICPPPPPVPPVPKECIFDACQNQKDSFNIAFLIDESGSVGRTNYLTSLSFVEKMIKNDINDISRISMLSFASRNDRLYSFSDNQNDQKAGALAALQQERADYNSGSTCTGTALSTIADEFAAQTNPTDNNVLFLLTDGHPNCGLAVCDQKAKLDAAGVTTYVVGITGGFSASKVSCLVQGYEGPLDRYIITIPKFTSQLFYHIEAQLRRVVCPPNVFINQVMEFVADGGSSYLDGGNNKNYWLELSGLVLLSVIGAFIYYNRERICRTNEKYQALMDEGNVGREIGYQTV